MDQPKQDSRIQQLLDCIHSTPIIDHHAHNLLLPLEQESHPMLSMTTEATGEALQQTSSTLAHMRAVRQLAKILDCEPEWDTVCVHLQRKRKEDLVSWARFCFYGIETVLVDDGLDANTVYAYDWHNRLTRSPCKRIVRIENIAEILLTRLVKHMQVQGRQILDDKVIDTLLENFRTEIKKAIHDPEVVGFKSVICYRTGLALSPVNQAAMKGAIKALVEHSDPLQKASRLQDDVLSPGFVHITAQSLVEYESTKPFQFHTGLGDNDIRLRFSSPSHLQSFIEQYSSVPIILLHASYPYTKDAGYLASVYPNVYLDIGEIFPMVSQEGQQNAVREALELCPSEKLTWSTDGHWFPETYLLATLQIKQALEKGFPDFDIISLSWSDLAKMRRFPSIILSTCSKVKTKLGNTFPQVLQQYVLSKSLTVPQAIKVVEDLFFNTSNRLYDLDLELKPVKRFSAVDEMLESRSAATPIGGIEILDKFLNREPTIKYLRLQWVDYSATVRVRILPVKSALELFTEGKGVSVTKAVLGLLQDDSMSAGVRPVGHYQLRPAFSSLCLGARAGYAMVQCEFKDDDGQPVPTCPRTLLRTTVERARAKGIDFLVGFEIEVVFLYNGPEGNDSESGSGVPRIIPGQCWSTARALHDDKMMDLLESIMTQLEKSGIGIQQFHPESAPGQYEFVMDPMDPLAAVDSFICAKDIIMTIASKFGMRATLVPKSSAAAAGTGLHIHVSMTPGEKHEHFLAGLLKSLNGILAITYPNVASYERVGDSTWSGGTWVAWGTQNRETPIRYISGSRYEIKCMDGLANPYLALAAILATGLQGLLDNQPLHHKNCQDDPALLSEDDRNELGISKQVPGSIKEALDCFRSSETLRQLLGSPVFENFLAVKEAENEMLQRMENEERRGWLIKRY
ncbi:MAG: hypothetical protein Q9218_005769 [Villophora microphyllina]